MLLQIHTNSFFPLAFALAFSHRMPSPCFMVSPKCVVTFTNAPKCEFGNRYDKTRTRTNSKWQCLRSGMGEPVSCLSEWEVQEGEKAVTAFLQQLGVSEEESQSIASNSPAYLNMLVEGVRDLEQLPMSMWDNSSSSGLGFGEFNFRDKLLHIAAHKGDNGKLAYLESLGFTLPSSMNVARYIVISSDDDSLPSLIHKVNFIKQLFFSPTPTHDIIDYVFLIKNIRRMMCHLSISIDEDLQHTLSFFEKLEARRGGLNIFATSKDAAFCYLIESFPRILLLSVNNHMARILDFLQNIIGIPRNRTPNILLAFPPILLWNLQLLKTRALALKEIYVLDKDYVKLMLKYPWVLSTSIQENYKEVLVFLYSVKVPKTHINRVIIREPHLLGCSASKLKLGVDRLAELGVPRKKLVQVIAKSPQLLLRKPEDFLQLVLFFKDMDFDKENIGKILARCPQIFAASISKTLQRKIQFLRRIGVSKTFLPVVIKKYPELLMSDINKTLPQRIMYLMKLGLSEKEIASMVCTFSPLLGYSINGVLMPKIEFLVNTMKRPVRDVVGYPRYFSYSLETKIKPRYWVLKQRNIECSLKDMLRKNDEEFVAKFIDVGRMPVCPSHSYHDTL